MIWNAHNCKGQTPVTPLHLIKPGGCNLEVLVSGVLGITLFNRIKAGNTNSNKPSRGLVR